MSTIQPYNPKTEDGFGKNVIFQKNLISPYADQAVISGLSRSDRHLVDTNYGLVYDAALLEAPAAVYGKMDDLPEYSGDSLSNYGFLRVPFRKIPRVLLKNRADLDSFLGKIELRDPNLQLLFRGQTREYTVEREPGELQRLYGNEASVEPSLIPSCLRKKMLIEDVLPIWNNMLHSYLDNQVYKSYPAAQAALHRKLTNFKCSPNFPLFSLALAQHYGLPSVGLDATDEIETALFFATHRFTKNDKTTNYQYVLPTLKAPAVIYVMAPAELFQLNYTQFAGPDTNFLRPDCQQARFLHTGWGLNQNRPARQIWLALYLDPSGDFGNIATTEQLFPKDDPFIDHVKPMIDLISHGDITKYFEGFYILDK